MTNKLYTIQLIDKPIEAVEIASHISTLQNDLSIGAHTIFLGQVREDEKEQQTVSHIEYTTFREMAESTLEKICKEASKTYSASHINILHSLGKVKKGELCLFVLVACGHRKESFNCCEDIVEQIKKEVPIWGKEILSDNSHLWKVNNF